ncbi:MAG: MFS transporter [Dehalococcoidia bacterium]
MTQAPPARPGSTEPSDANLAGAAAIAAARTRPRFLPPTFDSLLHGPFRWYMAAMLGWNSAMSMSMLVRGYLAYDLTGSFAALGVMSLASAVPMLVLSAWGGVIADRMPRKAVIQFGQVAGVILALALAALIFAGMLRFEYLLAMAVLHGAVIALMMPAQQAMLPEVVGMDRMMNAVPLNAAGMNLMQIFAPAAGGFLIVAIGPAMVYVIMAALEGLSVLTLFRVRTTPLGGERAPSRRPGRRSAGGLSELREGMRYLGRDRTILVLLMFSFVASVLSMPIRMLLPGYVAEVFDSDAIGLGQMQAAMGVGALIGALALASVTVRRKRGIQVVAFEIGLGVALVVFAAANGFLLAAALLFVVGLGTAGRQALGQVLLHEYVENEYRGRVMAIFMMQFAVMSLGTFLVGLFAELVGPQVAIGSLGVTLVIVAIAFLVLVPRLRRLE